VELGVLLIPILIIVSGAIALAGNAAALLNNPQVRHAYLGE